MLTPTNDKKVNQPPLTHFPRSPPGTNQEKSYRSRNVYVVSKHDYVRHNYLKQNKETRLLIQQLHLSKNIWHL